MSIGMALLINGIIGMIVYPISVLLFQRWCYHKFGEQASEDGLNDANRLSELGYDMMSKGNERTGAALRVLSWFITIFLWEIGIPVNFYVIYMSIKK